MRPPGATYNPTYGYSTGSTSYAPPAPPHYTQYQSSYYAGYASAAYQPRTQYGSGWSSYQYYNQPSASRYTVGTVYTAPNVVDTSSTPPSSSMPQASSSQATTSTPQQSLESGPSSQCTPTNTQAVANNGERPSYTAMTYQGYASYNHPSSYSAQHPSSPPAPANAPPMPSLSTSYTTTSHPPLSNYAPPPPATVSPAPNTFQSQSQNHITQSGGTSLRWQRPYTGPKTTTEVSPPSSTVPSHAPTPQPQAVSS